jgi:hypothetical protein
MATINGDCANGEIVSSTTTFSTCGERARARRAEQSLARQPLRTSHRRHGRMEPRQKRQGRQAWQHGARVARGRLGDQRGTVVGARRAHARLGCRRLVLEWRRGPC